MKINGITTRERIIVAVARVLMVYPNVRSQTQRDIAPELSVVRMLVVLFFATVSQ